MNIFKNSHSPRIVFIAITSLLVILAPPSLSGWLDMLFWCLAFFPLFSNVNFYCTPIFSSFFLRFFLAWASLALECGHQFLFILFKHSTFSITDFNRKLHLNLRPKCLKCPKWPKHEFKIRIKAI